MITNPKVSVVMITYGHENFISEALDGIFMQKTSFPVEVIIANDASPDNSEKIITEKIKNLPENFFVKYTRHEKNLGIMPNFNWALSQANGVYIAICEGDDYWTDPEKLQKQYDFLEKNMDYNACGGLAKVILEGDENYTEIYGIPKGDFEAKDFLTTNNLVTCTVMFRNSKKFHVPRHHAFGDWTVYMQILEKGRAYVFNEIFAIYRRHKNGAMQSVNKKYYLHYANQFAYNLHKSNISPHHLSEKQKEEINQAFFQHFLQSWRDNNYSEAAKIFVKHFRLMKKILATAVI